MSIFAFLVLAHLIGAVAGDLEVRCRLLQPRCTSNRTLREDSHSFLVAVNLLLLSMKLSPQRLT